MANYDRRLLVPYLQDVCSVEMLCSKLERDVREKEKKITEMDRFINQRIVKPLPPRGYTAENGFNYFLFFVLSVIPLSITLVLIIILITKGDRYNGAIILSAAVGIFFGCCLLSEIACENRETEQKNINAYNNYKQRLADNQNLLEQIEVARQTIPVIEMEILQLQQRLVRATKLRTEVYSVNIIPSRYRSVHVAYYLYDFFHTSRETDLEKTIQTMLLDEIIQRLDQIIVQNEAILLNQRMQLAMQENQNRMMAEHNRKELQAIVRLEQNQQLQLDYQNMINANQMVTNFFLAADYIERHR